MAQKYKGIINATGFRYESHSRKCNIYLVGIFISSFCRGKARRCVSRIRRKAGEQRATRFPLPTLLCVCVCVCVNHESHHYSVVQTDRYTRRNNRIFVL